jgi:hypothetical protein
MKKKTNENRIVLELINDDLKVEVIGNGGTLTNMFAAAMMDDTEFRNLVQMSLLKVLAVELSDDEDNELDDEVAGRLSTDVWNKAIGHA